MKLLVSRPVFPMGKDIGYLPGTVEEKLNPWMQPIFDNLEFLFSREKDGKKNMVTKISKNTTFRYVLIALIVIAFGITKINAQMRFPNGNTLNLKTNSSVS